MEVDPLTLVLVLLVLVDLVVLVGAWTVPVTVGTYDQSRGVGGTSPFGPNRQGQSGPGGGGSGNPGGSSFFKSFW